MLSNTLGLKFFYLKIILILHPGYHPEIANRIYSEKKQTKSVSVFIRLIITEMNPKIPGNICDGV